MIYKFSPKGKQSSDQEILGLFLRRAAGRFRSWRWAGYLYLLGRKDSGL